MQACTLLPSAKGVTTKGIVRESHHFGRPGVARRQGCRCSGYQNEKEGWGSRPHPGTPIQALLQVLLESSAAPLTYTPFVTWLS